MSAAVGCCFSRDDIANAGSSFEEDEYLNPAVSLDRHDENGPDHGARQGLASPLDLQSRVNQLEIMIDRLHSSLEVFKLDKKVAPAEELRDAIRFEVQQEVARALGAALQSNKRPDFDRHDLENVYSLTVAEVDEMAMSGMDYSWQASMWDCCVLLGHPCLGLLDSIAVAVGALSNCCLQVVFALIIYASLTENEMDATSVLLAKRWRSTVGHDVRYADPLTHVSLVSQVCNQNRGLHLAGTQLALSNDLSKYMYPTHESLSELNGDVLCTLGILLLVWALLCDCRDNMHLAVAVWCHPRGPPRIELDGKGSTYMSKVAKRQIFLLTIFAVLPRVVVQVLLLISGSVFLAYTENVENLVMNAMALVFILDIDELSFAVFAPIRVQGLLGSLKPIPLHATLKQHMGTLPARILRIVCLPLLSALALAVIHAEFLKSFRANMHEAYRWLCGGDLDFVYTINKASGVVYYSDTPSFQPKDITTYAEATLVALTEVLGSSKKDLSNNTQAIKASQFSTIMTLHREGMSTAARALRCVDHLDYDDVVKVYGTDINYFAMREVMREASFNKSLESCRHLPRDLCHMNHECVTNCLQYGGGSLQSQCPQLCGCDTPWSGISTLCFTDSNVRAACPQTCGCDTPWSGLTFASDMHGCPAACAEKLKNYLLEYNDARSILSDYRAHRFVQKKYLHECDDPARKLLNNLTSWRRYVYGFEILAETYVGVRRAQDLARALITGGCESVAHIHEKLGIPICDVGAKSVGLSARPWCPGQCGCFWEGNSDKSECPGGCLKVFEHDHD